MTKFILAQKHKKSIPPSGKSGHGTPYPTEIETRKVSDIIFREDLYPRINKDPQLVQRYAENIEVLPPIQINQDNILIDGWHRWTAYRKLNSEDIPDDVKTRLHGGGF